MSALNRSLAFRAVSAFLLLGCSALTEPGPGAPPLQAEPAPAAAPASAAPAPSPAPPPPPPAPEEQIGASHILIAYKGALRAAETITRSKDEAQKLAKTVQAKAKGKGADFAALARQYSDDPTAKAGGGSLGKFAKTQMVKPFADAAFALKPGEISEIVETGFGFHVIKRTE